MLAADLIVWYPETLLDMAKTKSVVSCDHEKQLLTHADLKRTVEIALPILRRHKHQFDSFVVTGYSSSLIGSILALKMKKNLTILRKDSDSRHSRHMFEGVVGSRNVFVDDLVSSGDTLKFVYRRLQEFHCSLYGVYLYFDGYGAQTSVDNCTLIRCTDCEVKNLNLSS